MNIEAKCKNCRFCKEMTGPHDSYAANLLDKDGNIVTYCYWNYVVPISEFNFEDLHSNVLNALQ